MSLDFDLDPVLRAFGVPTRQIDARAWGSGHIHDTYRIEVGTNGDRRRFLLQRVNAEIFPDPEAVTETIRRVTEHIRQKLEERRTPDVARRVLDLLETADGRACLRADDGRWWRVYRFIDRARSYDVATSPAMARSAAFAFGAFQRDLTDLSPPRLPDTLPGFHDTPARYAAFRRALEADVAGRAEAAAPEITFALDRERMGPILLEAHRSGEIPERVTHNDTKINNVLFDDATGEAICVIDLDTVMPGLGLYDFGDLVRTSVSRTPEDETDLAKVHADPELYEALAAGYLDAMGERLTKTERDLLAFSGRLITLEIGLRFLTDYLEGDVYFKTRRPGQNLDRCRAQFALVRSLEEQARELRRVTRELG